MSVTLIEKYKPRNLEDLKLPKRIHDLLLEKSNVSGFRLLFYGSYGTGKTSTSLLISKGHDVLYLSGSNDFNIAVMREKVYPFCSNHSVLGKQKTIIVDECENISDKIQDAFKITLDSSKSVNFIFITNEVEKVNGAIMSRCTQINYNFQDSEIEEQKANYANFIKKVCTEENIKYDGTGIMQLYKINFPDFRHLLVTLQQFVDSKQDITEKSVKLITETSAQNIELYEAFSIIDDKDFFQKCSEFKGKERDCFLSLGEPFFKYLATQNKYGQILKIAPVVGRYCFEYLTSVSKFTTFFACMCEIKAILR